MDASFEQVEVTASFDTSQIESSFEETVVLSTFETLEVAPVFEAPEFSVSFAGNAFPVSITNVEKTTTLFDETTTPGVIYIGKALPIGSAISEEEDVWSIKSIDMSTDTEIKWADGVTSYTKIWADRAGYSYF